MTKASARHGMNLKAKHHLRRAGYAVGGAVGEKTSDKNRIRPDQDDIDEAKQVETSDKRLTKFNISSAVEGKNAPRRLDRTGFRRGGKK